MCYLPHTSYRYRPPRLSDVVKSKRASKLAFDNRKRPRCEHGLFYLVQIEFRQPRFQD